MKTKLFLLIFLFTGISFIKLSAQDLKKGAVVAVSSYEFNLAPGVTMDKFMDFYSNKYLPEFEKSYPGVKGYMLTGDRGENKNKVGALLVFESVAVRDKYYPRENDTTSSAALKQSLEKMKAMDAELNKYVVSGNRIYTDWIVK